MSTVPLLSLCVQDMVILRGRRFHVRPSISHCGGQAVHLNALTLSCLHKSVLTRQHTDAEAPARGCL